MRFLLLMTVPICKTCIHYIPSKYGNFNDPVSAKCKKIGTVDVINGEIEYSSVQSVREDACGQQGIMYKPEPRMFLKKLTHYLRKNSNILAYLLLLSLWFRSYFI
jgi:hypothetical protein